MKEYSYTELGMLFGAALGAIISAVGFSLTANYLFLLIAAVGMAAGIWIGMYFDKRKDSISEKNSKL